MTTLSRLFCAALFAAAATTAVGAHHSFAMFDNSKEVVLVGEVVRWAFNSPHTAIQIKDAKGAVWSLEGAAPPAVVGRSPKMDGRTFKAGDPVTAIHCPLRDGRTGGAIGFVVTKDGTWYRPADGGCNVVETNWRKWLAAGYTSKAQAEAATKS